MICFWYNLETLKESPENVRKSATKLFKYIKLRKKHLYHSSKELTWICSSRISQLQQMSHTRVSHQKGVQKPLRRACRIDALGHGVCVKCFHEVYHTSEPETPSCKSLTRRKIQSQKRKGCLVDPPENPWIGVKFLAICGTWKKMDKSSASCPLNVGYGNIFWKWYSPYHPHPNNPHIPHAANPI